MKPIAIGSSHHRVARSDRKGVHAVRRVSDVHERTERATRIDLCALAHKNAGTERVCPFHEVSNQDSLADTGLAGDERGPASAADAFAQKGLELSQLGVASDEDGTKDPSIRDGPNVCCHAPSGLDSVTRWSAVGAALPVSLVRLAGARRQRLVRTWVRLVDGVVRCGRRGVVGPVRVLRVAEYRLTVARGLCRAGKDLARSAGGKRQARTEREDPKLPEHSVR